MGKNKTISILVPIYNEEPNLEKFHNELEKVINNIDYIFEIIFVNDGSKDKTIEIIKKIQKKDKRIKLINFSRNFGKEIATTAAINSCTGEAAILIDADLQHPPKYIKDFINKWENGADVVVGVRKTNSGEGFIKRIGSIIFYKLINKIADTKLVPNSTDFRLIDRVVINEFNKLTEHNRITRGLIDWVGFERDFVYFNANRREFGQAGYSTIKLVKLAFNSIVSLSLFPLRLAGYLGIFITILSGLIGFFVFIFKYIYPNPWGTSISGSAIIAIIIMFLIGIVLICLGLIALYIANIYSEVLNRPLYIIKKDRMGEK